VTTTTTTTGGQTIYALSGSVVTIHGVTIQLSSFQGKSLILYFTGASCIPCKAQLPDLVAAYNQYKSTNKIEVISLDIQGQTIDALKTWESQNGITWNVCQDTGYALSSRFSIYSMPTLVILNVNGIEVNRYVGQQTQATINTIFQNAANI
jgi:peroxiredoxin